MLINNNNYDEYFTKINYLINKIEQLIKKCSKKYADKCEIDLLYAHLTVCKLNIIYFY